MSEPMAEADYILDILKERAPDLADWLEARLATLARLEEAAPHLIALASVGAIEPARAALLGKQLLPDFDATSVTRGHGVGFAFGWLGERIGPPPGRRFAITDPFDLGPGRITINGEEVEATRRSITFTPTISSGDFLTMDLSPETHDERMARLIREGRVGPR